MRHCPECGKDLRDLDPAAHALDHWPGGRPDPRDPKSAEAVKRFDALMEEAEA